MMVTAIAQTLHRPPGGDKVFDAFSRPESVSARLGLLAALGRELDPRDPEVVRQAAAEVFSELFFAPLLAEMRQFPFGRELATEGQTEAAFGQQLDQRIADTVAGNNEALLRQLVRRLQGMASAEQGSGEAAAQRQADSRAARGEA